MDDKVIVITGASSGNGRAAALAFARRGATLVLAARRGAVLEELASECERLGGRALAVPTDVTDPEEVEALAGGAVRAFGRIDVWINNAGVQSFARFEEMPPEEFRRILDTNLFGYVHGARAVLPHFRRQGHGNLVNTVSLFGYISAPYYSAYVASKHAVKGWLESLREELRGTDIDVCMVVPATIDTPLYQHAANHRGHAIQVPPPIFDPQEVADAMVSLVENPRRQAFAPPTVGRATAALHAASPSLFERFVAWFVPRVHFSDTVTPHRSGNLFEPTPEGTSVEGGWRTRRRGNRWWTLGALVAGVVGLAWYVARDDAK